MTESKTGEKNRAEAIEHDRDIVISTANSRAEGLPLEAEGYVCDWYRKE